MRTFSLLRIGAGTNGLTAAAKRQKSAFGASMEDQRLTQRRNDDQVLPLADTARLRTGFISARTVAFGA